MLNRVRGDYGAPYENRDPIVDPRTELDAAKYNTMAEDSAEMTRTSWRILLKFPTISSVANTTPSFTETHWGSGASYFPTSVARTGTGIYTATYPATFALPDATDESVAFVYARGSVQSTSVYGHVQCTASANVILIGVFDAAGALTDITDGTTLLIEAR